MTSPSFCTTTSERVYIKALDGLCPADRFFAIAQELRQVIERGIQENMLELVLRRQPRRPFYMMRCILTHLSKRGRLVEPLPLRGLRVRRPRPPRPWATRKPRDYRVEQPGDLVEVDTMDLRSVPALVLKQFTARDAISRWDVVEFRHRATSRAAAFLESLQARLPFPIRAIQVDGGSEFAAVFEQACHQRGLRLLVLPPRSPQTQRARRPRQPHPHGGIL